VVNLSGYPTTTGQLTNVNDHAAVEVVPAKVACTKFYTVDGGPATNNAQVSDQTPHTIVWYVTVTNLGIANLEDVTVTDIGLPCTGSYGPFRLDRGASTTFAVCTNASFNCTNAGTQNTISIVNSQFTVTVGTNRMPVCPVNLNGTNIVVHSTCSSAIICSHPPCIGVTKEVACYLGNNTCGTFGKFAAGVQGDNGDPSFCYRITITNCSATVALTNVTVVDTIYGDLTANFSCISGGVLAPASGCSFVFRAAVGTTNGNVTFVTNVVNLSGYPTSTGQLTNVNDHAAVEVIPASVACQKFYTIDGGAPTNNAKISDQTPHTIVWYVTVTNTGVANLGDVSVTDVGLPCTVTYGGLRLDQGASITFAVCTNASFTCGTNSGVENTITIVNDQFTMGTNHAPVCGTTLSGSNIVVRSECPAMISCISPTACRVTGGGRQDEPIVYPDNVRYVTHGGQVGAPVGNKVCVVTEQFFLGNPCIHGRWTHVRHMQGGLEGNFHARYYDTLDCACLDTNYSPATVTVPGVDGVGPQTYVNLVYGPATVVDGVCGNRNIGPLPRPAPANKIVFTGVGDWADPNGRRAGRSVLFRVDIEDRGEPGNDHALDQNGKAGRVPDRYRIRIWVLSDQELAELNGSGPDKYLLNFRNAISACNGINVQDGASVPNGTAAFGVRAPDVDDGGELLHGNHQIHPSIKACDPNNPQAPPLPKP
jgi:hypothetical protein